MNIYITRHGESVSNADGYIAYLFTGLSEKGMKDAYNLGKRLKKEKIKIDAIYCSSLFRTLQTLDQILKSGFEVDLKKIYITDLLTEINRYEYSGRPSSEYYAVKESFNGDPNDYCPKDGESENDVRKRAEKFKKMIEKDNFENILVVTHGHFLGHFAKLYDLNDLGHCAGASLSLIQTSPKKIQLCFWNDTKHLL